MFQEKHPLHRWPKLLIAFVCVAAPLTSYAVDPLPASDAPDNTAAIPAFRTGGDLPAYAAAGTPPTTPSVPGPAPSTASAPSTVSASASGSQIDEPPPLFEKSGKIAPTTAPTVPPSENVTINLINRLVQRNVLSKEDAADLIKQAEQDAETAKIQAIQNAQTAVAAAAAQQEATAPSPDAVRVTYVPEVVKDQMREEVTQQVMKQAHAEGWATPKSAPEWTSRFRFFGDIRVRYNTGAFPNFNSINTGAPFDVAGNTFSPQNNVDQNRNRFRLRARLGADVDLGEGFTAGIRIATGENDSPVSENQSLGAANNGQGGNFSKYSLWLDRAFIKYETGGEVGKDFSVTVGRFDNPFFATKMIWADDLGFDGVVLQAHREVLKGFTPFLTAGAFPVFNTDFNFATTQPAKFQSEDKYLYAIQVGADWKATPDISAKLGAAYYDFDNIEGKLSSPFTPLSSSDQGDTDDSRPAFAQNGNTYMALRDIVPTAANDFGTIDQFQYFGLASTFRELAVTGRIDYGHFDPFHISLTTEFVTNTAFDRNSVASKAVNNFGSTTATGVGSFVGGNNAWIVDFKIGNAALEKRGDWNLGVNYRYVESDSVVDGFNDSDFGAPLSGTNLKGYSLYGSLALAQRVWLSLRWMSADSIAGPPYRNDIIQLDLNTKF